MFKILHSVSRDRESEQSGQQCDTKDSVGTCTLHSLIVVNVVFAALSAEETSGFFPE